MRTSLPPVDELDSDEVGKPYPYPRRDPQTTAWVVLSIAFGAFWLLLIGAFLGAKYYYDTAALPHTGTLSREQGIVLFRDAVSSTLMNAHDNLEVREGDELLVGQDALASIALFDGSRVRLYSGSELRIDDLSASRFHDGFTHVTLKLNKGTARLEIAEPSTRSRRFVAATPHGQALLSPGSFGLAVTDDSTRISSRAGVASVLGPEGSVELGAGEKVILTPGHISGPLPEGDQLLANGDFSKGFAQWQLLQVDEAGRPVEPGRRALVTERINGSETAVLHLDRVSEKATHNETGLIQVVDRDVSDYLSLHLVADIKVDEQSLSGGGYMGYEYPVMIRVRYRDASGGQIDWSHGFFYRNPEDRPTPNGEQVPQGRWIHYVGELMEIKPKPVHIISVEVLSAGHTFSGSIANVSLVGK